MSESGVAPDGAGQGPGGGAGAQELQPELQAWIDDGGDIRHSMADVMPGRCGGLVRRSNGSKAKVGTAGQYCGNAAGRGTGFKNGRCSLHMDDYGEGIPPWAGELTREERNLITGGSLSPGAETHGAAKVVAVRQSFEDYVRELLDEEDRVAFDSVQVDPVKVIDTEIRLNRVQAARILRWLKQARIDRAVAASEMGEGQQLGTKATESQILTAESSLRHLSQTLARLMEVRARYSEIAEDRRKDDFIREALRGVPSDRFAALRSEPWRLREYLDKGRAN